MRRVILSSLGLLQVACRALGTWGVCWRYGAGPDSQSWWLIENEDEARRHAAVGCETVLCDPQGEIVPTDRPRQW